MWSISADNPACIAGEYCQFICCKYFMLLQLHVFCIQMVHKFWWSCYLGTNNKLPVPGFCQMNSSRIACRSRLFQTTDLIQIHSPALKEGITKPWVFYRGMSLMLGEEANTPLMLVKQVLSLGFQFVSSRKDSLLTLVN